MFVVYIVFTVLNHGSPSIAHEFLYGVFPGQAIAAEQLQRLTGHFKRSARGKGLGCDRAQQVRAILTVVVGKYPVRQRSGGLHLLPQLKGACLHTLVIDDGDAGPKPAPKRK